MSALPEPRPPEREPDADAIARLAKLPPLEYDRVRAAEAERLGVRAATLDAQVQRRRTDAAPPDAGGTSVLFAKLEPWPEPVDGAALLDALADSARRHLVLPPGAAVAMALWTIHAHAHDAAQVSPLLALTSPTPECGKTTCLTWLGALVPKALPASNITPAALFRAVELWRPTLLVDEADTFLRESDELRGVLNSGHHRASASVVRTVGDDHQPRAFSTWSPKAVAMIGRLHATLASRAVHVELRRKAAGEHVEPLRLDRTSHLTELGRKAARWAADHLDRLRDADPDMPDGLHGRAADNWRALLAIADAAGGDWPARAREAAQALEAGRSEQTAGVLLLEDLRTLFAERGTDRLASADIVQALGEMESRPWPEWHHGRPLTVRQLARLLEPFGIRPKDMRGDGWRCKGYAGEDCRDAFARYLPATLAADALTTAPADSSATPRQMSTGAAFRESSSATSPDDVADRKPLKASTGADCRGVADEIPGGAVQHAVPCPRCAGEGCAWCDSGRRVAV